MALGSLVYSILSLPSSILIYCYSVGICSLLMFLSDILDAFLSVVYAPSSLLALLLLFSNAYSCISKFVLGNLYALGIEYLIGASPHILMNEESV